MRLIITQSILHENEHLKREQARAPPIAEIEVDKDYPSFAARQLYRIVYVQEELRDLRKDNGEAAVVPNVERFLRKLEKDSQSDIVFATYLDAYVDLEAEQDVKQINKQLMIAEGLLRRRKRKEKILKR